MQDILLFFHWDSSNFDHVNSLCNFEEPEQDGRRLTSKRKGEIDAYLHQMALRGTFHDQVSNNYLVARCLNNCWNVLYALSHSFYAQKFSVTSTIMVLSVNLLSK